MEHMPRSVVCMNVKGVPSIYYKDYFLLHRFLASHIYYSINIISFYFCEESVTYVQTEFALNLSYKP
jgi:hypothetical protein